MTRIFLTIILIVTLTIGCSAPVEEQIIEVIAKDFRFETVDSVPSGWNNFRFANTGHAEHFFFLVKMPDSISFDRYHREVTRSFDIAFDSLKAGWSKEAGIGLLVSLIPG